MRKEFEFVGCVEVQPELSQDAFLDALLELVESKGWYFGGGVREIQDGFYINPDGTRGKSVLQNAADEHQMKLHREPFEHIKSGIKTIELRLWDEKRRKIKVGDSIVFTNTKSGERIKATVCGLHLFADFKTLYASLPLLKCGYTEADIATARASDMDAYYSPEEQAKYGVVGIELSEVLCFRNAVSDDAEAVWELYCAAKGKEFCAWDEEYPSMQNIMADLERGNLYVLTERGRVIGAASVEAERELDGFDCWRYVGDKQCEIARVVVHGDCRGRGLAYGMVKRISEILRERGFEAIHLSASKGNKPALRTYERLGMNVAGEAELYGGEYLLLEYLL